VAIRLTFGRKELPATGEDLCNILVEALDEKGTLCSLANSLIRFDVEGPAEIADVGNGNTFRLSHFRRTDEGCFTAR
jgi:beta-galactosidase